MLSPKTLDAILRVLAKHGRTLATIEATKDGLKLGLAPVQPASPEPPQVEADPPPDDPTVGEFLDDPIISRMLNDARQ